MNHLKLIVGLGNPGPEYTFTRHNAGFWLVDEMAARWRAPWQSEKKFYGEVARARAPEGEVWLLKPQTFMNLSGQAVLALAHFYRIPPEEILVIHDEMDLPCGTAKLKKGGGNGGHNGLKDIQAKLSSPEFWRLRIGIGHPGERSQVVGHVLKKPTQEEMTAIDNAMSAALAIIDPFMRGDTQGAIQTLHRTAVAKPAPAPASAPKSTS